MRNIIDEIADMSSVQGEYVRLMSVAITDGMTDLMELIKKGESEKTQDIILKTAIKCYEISNADFGDNFNPHHREEQPF